MDGVRALTRQVAHPSRVARELLGQMCTVAFALGMVFAGITESAARHDDGWTTLFSLLFGTLLYLYWRTALLWYAHIG